MISIKDLELFRKFIGFLKESEEPLRMVLAIVCYATGAVSYAYGYLSRGVRLTAICIIFLGVYLMITWNYLNLPKIAILQMKRIARQPGSKVSLEMKKKLEEIKREKRSRS